MKKILILGCCGAGKSTLALKLHQILNIEIVHLDQYYWLPEWMEPTEKLWRKTVSQLVKREGWIMDGNYSGTLDIRVPAADTIIYLNYSTITCLSRVIKRVVKYQGQNRPDMPVGCQERFDLEFLHYVLTFNLRRGRALKKRLSLLSDKMKIIILENDREADQFIGSLKSKT